MRGNTLVVKRANHAPQVVGGTGGKGLGIPATGGRWTVGLYEDLRGCGAGFSEPPRDKPWERAMSLLDPDGYRIEFAQGHRGRNRTD